MATGDWLVEGDAPRLETAGVVKPARYLDNERQAILAPTDARRAVESTVGGLGVALLGASGQTPKALGRLDHAVSASEVAATATSGLEPGRPLWFNAPPAILKGYVDRVFGSR